MAIQWHPLFAQLLRPLLEDYFEIQTGVAVGDLPREADLVLLRRKVRKPLPFIGLWKNLTAWNVLEYKGPTVSARLGDLDLLTELGLGIHRRFNEQRGKNKQPPLKPYEVSFWYLANRLGRTFLEGAEHKIGGLNLVADGLWRGQVLHRPIFLVSGTHLPVALESVPFHVLGSEPPEKELEVARLVVEQPVVRQMYRDFLMSLHPSVLEEIMGKTRSKQLQFHLRPLIEFYGPDKVADEIVDEMSLDRLVDKFRKKKKLSDLLALLTPAEREELRRRKE
jgi:hypothetical protein